MNTIKNVIEDSIVATIQTVRDIVSPIFNKYAAYFKYINYFLYTTYIILLFGFYNTLPEYIPVLRNILLYSAVVLLIIRFNTISWSNPKFAILGGSVFSDFDRRLIMHTCFFILITHILSETIINYTRSRVSQNVILPIRSEIVNPIRRYINLPEVSGDGGFGGGGGGGGGGQ